MNTTKSSVRNIEMIKNMKKYKNNKKKNQKNKFMNALFNQN